jgi:hypothetical protein
VAILTSTVASAADPESLEDCRKRAGWISICGAVLAEVLARKRGELSNVFIKSVVHNVLENAGNLQKETRQPTISLFEPDCRDTERIAFI